MRHVSYIKTVSLMSLCSCWFSTLQDTKLVLVDTVSNLSRREEHHVKRASACCSAVSSSKHTARTGDVEPWPVSYFMLNRITEVFLEMQCF